MKQLEAGPNGCQEASPLSGEQYVPCNAPAEYVVDWAPRKDQAIRMCVACADHNVRNRGGRVVGRWERVGDSPPPAKQQGPTADQIVKTYLDLRDYKEARTKQFNEGGATEMQKLLLTELRRIAANRVDELDREPIKAAADLLEQLLTPMKVVGEAMASLEAAAGQMIATTGQTALKTEFGTAFRKPFTSVKVADRDSFLAWVFARGSREFLTNHVSKEAVQNYQEANKGESPPGVATETIIQIQFRKS